MFRFVRIEDGEMTFINGIDEEDCRKASEAAFAVRETLEVHFLVKCIAESWSALEKWDLETPCDTNHLMRNLHTSERLVRSFLFEFRTCLDHLETAFKRKNSEDPQLWNVFKLETNKAYDNCPEYAFTYHLRNCSQHCENVVHCFSSSSNSLGISSSKTALLSGFSGWKETDRIFLSKKGESIELIPVFSKAFDALQEAMKAVIGYLLNHNEIGENLWYLRKWGDSLSSQLGHEVHSFHIVEMVCGDGSSAKEEDFARDDISIKAVAVDWDLIYELTDMMDPGKQ